MPPFLKNKKLLFAAIVVISIVLRLFLAFYFEGTGDSGGWRLIGKTGLHGGQFGVGNGTVYDGDCPLLCGNWTPFTYHTYIVMRWAYENLNPLNFPQWGYYKLLPILSVIPILILIYRYGYLYKLPNKLFFVSLYAFHPISLYVSAYHGQRDAVWLAFLLVAIFLFRFKHFFLFSVIFAFAVSVKIPPLLLAPFFFLKLASARNRIFFIVSLPLVFFLLNLPEVVTHTENVIRQVFFYPGVGGWWGISGIIAKIDAILVYTSLLEVLKPVNKLLAYTAVVVGSFYFYYKKKEILESVLGIIMIIFVFSPIFASQYLLWPLPFLVLLYKKYKKYFWYYTAFGLIAASSSYGIYGLGFIEQYLLIIPREQIFYKIPFFAYPMDLFFPLWIFSIIFLIKIIRQR